MACAATPNSASGPATASTAAKACRRSAGFGSSFGRAASAAPWAMLAMTVCSRIKACRAAGAIAAKGGSVVSRALERASRDRRTPPRARASRIIMRMTASA